MPSFLTEKLFQVLPQSGTKWPQRTWIKRKWDYSDNVMQHEEERWKRKSYEISRCFLSLSFPFLGFPGQWVYTYLHVPSFLPYLLVSFTYLHLPFGHQILTPKSWGTKASFSVAYFIACMLLLFTFFSFASSGNHVALEFTYLQLMDFQDEEVQREEIRCHPSFPSIAHSSTAIGYR